MQDQAPGIALLAIVGVGCRFPGGADSAQAFWRLLCDEVDATGDVPASRWDAARYHDPNPAKMGKIVTRSSKYHAHVASGEFKEGDLVEIAEGRPISKTKSWTVTRLVEKSKAV